MKRTSLAETLKSTLSTRQDDIEAADVQDEIREMSEEEIDTVASLGEQKNPTKSRLARRVTTAMLNLDQDEDATIDLERAHTVADFAVIDSSFKRQMIDMLQPALQKDLTSVIKGRYVWRHVSEFSEVFSKTCGLLSTILAFASSSELTDDNTTRILAFTAGCIGSVAMVTNIFSNFSRTQALERSKALSAIVKSANIQDIPDVTESLNVQSND